MLLDRLRAPATLLALGAAYARRRPAGALTGLVSAVRIGVRVRAAPILRPQHDVLAPGELAPLCSLVSDTHLTTGGSIPAELRADPGQWPFEPASSDVLADGVGAVLEAIRRDAPRTVIWCGDEVDTGDPAEWARWRAAIASAPGLAHRMVPGNHDLCFNPPFDEDCTLARRALRERAFQSHGPRLADFPVVDTRADAAPTHVVQAARMTIEMFRSEVTSRSHPLLRLPRWYPARPASRALWTSATATELADLLSDPQLRAQLENMLRRVAIERGDVDSLLVFDDQCVHLAVTITFRRDPDRCAWSWVTSSSRAV